MSMKLKVAFLAAAGFTAIAGCGVSRHYANNTVKQLPFRSVNIDYSMQTQIALASGEHRSWRGYNHLSIQYPHPSPELGNSYAFVTLARVEQEEPEDWKDSIPRVGSILASDDQPTVPSLPPLQTRITREELAFLLEDLIADGYFDRGDRSGGIQLDVNIGDREASKPWDRVESFEDLVRSFDRNSVIQTQGELPEDGAATLIPDVVEHDQGFVRDRGPRFDDAGMPDKKRFF